MRLLKDSKRALLRATDGKPLCDTGIAPGSPQDFARRLRNLLPSGWFPAPPYDDEIEKAPVLAAILLGFGSVLSNFWLLLAQVQKQMRLATMSGAFLDMAAEDYFGAGGLSRQALESDDTYRKRIVSSILAPKNTRSAVVSAVRNITSIEPNIIEPMNAADCHAFGAVRMAACGGGYGWGSDNLRYGSSKGGHFFLETPRGKAPSALAICNAVNQVKAAGVTAWVKVED
ncbi:hypothetical protein A0U90_10115 [Kozakia baliensis]|nr:hypothetical protein A0U90_10115 [Kozakia baliensis]